MDANQPATGNPWGRSRALIDDELRSCEDYVTALRVCLNGEAVPSRQILRMRAYALQIAASYLVQAAQDAERWLGTCSEPMKPTSPDEGFTTICTLPAGHPGSHDDHPPMTPTERVREEARNVAELTTTLTNRLAMQTINLEQENATNSVPGDRIKMLHQITTKLSGLSYDVDRLAKDATNLVIDTQRDVATPEHVEPHHHQPSPSPAPGIDR